jgi:hypothetical protein
MKSRLIIIVLLVVICSVSGIASAQYSTFTWEEYNFSMPLQPGWIAVEDGQRLVAGWPEDVDLIINGENTTGLAMIVHIVPSPIAEDFYSNYEFVQFVDFADETTTSEINDMNMSFANIPPSSDGITGMLVFIEYNYMITFIAPQSTWNEDTNAGIYVILAGIKVSPEPLPRDTELTQRFTWRDISLSTPRDWLLANTGNQFQVMALTQSNKFYSARTFSYVEMWLGIRDLSYIRPLLNADSLLQYGAPLYRPERRNFTEITTFELGNMSASSVEVLDDDTGTSYGKAVLLLTPQHAYILVGRADPEHWEQSESQLFEEILNTVTIK